MELGAKFGAFEAAPTHAPPWFFALKQNVSKMKKIKPFIQLLIA